MVSSAEVVNIRKKLKEKIDKLGIAIQNSGDRLEKIGAFIRDLSIEVGKLDKEVILSNVRLSFGDIEEEIKKIRKAISAYKRYIRGGN